MSEKRVQPDSENEKVRAKARLGYGNNRVFPADTLLRTIMLPRTAV